MRQIRTIALATVAFLAFAAAAPAMTPEQALQWCDETRIMENPRVNAGYFAYCAGYVSGFGAGYATGQASQGSKLICPPETATTGEFTRLFLEYLKANYDKSWLLASPDGARFAIIDVLEENFPCQ